MRRPIAPIACILALVTGAWFGQAYTFFASANSIPAADTNNTAAEAAVWRFYDAIDLLLRTADESALRDVIAPDFVEHVDQLDAPSGRDGLVRYLASLRETYPALRLTPQDVVAQGDRVVARLAPMDMAGGAIQGIPLAGKEPWPRVDMLRVRGGQIVERWGDPTGYAPATDLFSETLTFSHHGDLIPILRRVTVNPGASDASYPATGPAIISIEAGDLEVSAVSDDRSSSISALANGRATRLTAGDAFTVADGVDFAVANRTAAPAVFLVLSLAQPVPDNLRTRAVDTSTSTEGFAIQDSAGDSAITVQDLAGNTVTLANPGLLSIELAQITLAPGARLAPHAVAGVEIAVVEAGTTTATIEGAPVSAWLMSPKGYSVVSERTAQLPAEFSLTASNGATMAYANESAEPATLLLLTVTPG